MVIRFFACYLFACYVVVCICPLASSTADDAATAEPVVSELKRVYSFSDPSLTQRDEYLSIIFNSFGHKEAPLEPEKPRMIRLQVSTADKQPVSDATVLVIVDTLDIYETKTNSDGTAHLSIPGEWVVNSIGVVKNGMSCDYREFAERKHQGDLTKGMILPKNFSGVLPLTMMPVNPKTIQVFDPDGAPISGIKLQVSSYSTASNEGSWSPWEHSMFKSTTDENGKAVFNISTSVEESNFCLELDCQRKDWAVSNQRSLLAEWVFVESNDEDLIPIHYSQLVELTGTVQDTSGEPIRDLMIQAMSCNPSDQLRLFHSTSDASGRWKIFVLPETNYYLDVMEKEWRSRGTQHVSVAATRCEAASPFVVAPNCRVYGKVTGTYQAGDLIRFRRSQPMEESKGVITVVSYQAETSKVLSRSTEINEDGTYECYLPSGVYDVDNSGTPCQSIITGKAKQLRASLHLEIPLARDIRFRVIDSETDLPVPNVFVCSQSFGEDRDHILGDTDEDGVYVKVDARLPNYACRVRGKDDHKQAYVLVESHQTEVEILLKPTIQVAGRLLNSAGYPVKNQKLVCAMPVDQFNSHNRTIAAGEAITDENGVFEFSSICADAPITLNIVDEKSAEGDDRSILIHAFQTSDKKTELGDVRIR